MKIENLLYTLLTLFWTMYPATEGLNIPDTVANVFEIPMSTLACWGAISKWFTLEKNINT